MRDQRSETVYYSTPATDGQRITLSWIHSIELTPWTETYEVRDGELVLREITLESYGAGTPSNEGVTRIEDGVIHVTELDRAVGAIRWVHSHDVDYEIEVDGEVVVETQMIPHRSYAEIVIENN
ncbi:MAG: DUF1850 domain-containing protein [bacterium]|nr:DUF1850 domain-containing protein [bacterium]